MVAPGAGERVKFGVASGFGFPPFRADPALVFEAVERRIKGSLRDLQHFLRDLPDALGDGPAVLGLRGEGFENQDVEGALDEVGWLSLIHI